ncbi:hypothetical protein JCM10213v2_008577 [Rhodosporidiobolus nylandii]
MTSLPSPIVRPPLPPVPFIQALPDFLPISLEGEVYDALHPFIPTPHTVMANAAARDPEGPLPYWDASLKAWHSQIHPAAWALLEVEDGADLRYVYDFGQFLVHHVGAGAADGPEGEAWLKEAQRRCQEVFKRVMERWTRFYLPHGVRELYILRYLHQHPQLPKAVLLKQLRDEANELRKESVDAVGIAADDAPTPTIVLVPVPSTLDLYRKSPPSDAPNMVARVGSPRTDHPLAGMASPPAKTDNPSEAVRRRKAHLEE